MKKCGETHQDDTGLITCVKNVGHKGWHFGWGPVSFLGIGGAVSWPRRPVKRKQETKRRK